MMRAKVYFATLLMLGFTVPRIYCAEEHNVDPGEQLFESIRDHDYVTAKQLIRAGANVNYKVPFGSDVTPLMVAVGNGDDIELIQMLVNHHADVRAVDTFGDTALHRLAEVSSVNFPVIAAILLAAGAKIDEKDADGNTPLHFAARRGFANSVQYLLSKGANPGIKNKKRKLPVDLVPEGPANDQLRRLFSGITYRSHYKK